MKDREREKGREGEEKEGGRKGWRKEGRKERREGGRKEGKRSLLDPGWCFFRTSIDSQLAF